MPIFSWSAFVLGSTATEITGTANVIDSQAQWDDLRCRSYRQCRRSSSPTAAQMSPARISLISSRLLACIFSNRPMRSLLRRPHVQHGVAGLQLPRVDANERQLADKRISHNLERQRGEWLFVVRLAVNRLTVIGIHPMSFRHIQRRRQIIHHRIQQRLYAFVLESRSHHHRKHFQSDGRLAQRVAQLVGA